MPWSACVCSGYENWLQRHPNNQTLFLLSGFVNFTKPDNLSLLTAEQEWIPQNTRSFANIYKRAYETLYLYIRRADMLPDYIDSSGGFSIRKQETAIPNYRAEYRRRAATRCHSESGRLQQRVYQRRTRSHRFRTIHWQQLRSYCQFLLPDR